MLSIILIQHPTIQRLSPRIWEDLERDKVAILAKYAGLVPEALDDLTPEEHHRVYRLLRLYVLAYPDGTLDVSGALADGDELGTSGLTQTRDSQKPQPPGLRFRALLTANGPDELR